MKFIHSIFVATLLFLGYSCTKDSAGVSKVTDLVAFELTGGERVLVPMGGSYADPGYKAMEGTTDVTSHVVVNSDVKGNEVGLYHVTYSAVNSDGFPSSAARTVIIYDPNAPDVDLAGNYLSTVSRAAPARGPYLDLKVSITKVAPGFFYISDFLGGFYDQGFGYGPDYSMTGFFKLNSDYTIDMVSSHVNAWGNSLDDLTNGVYDPATATLSWHAFYVGAYDFSVSMIKK